MFLPYDLIIAYWLTAAFSNYSAFTFAVSNAHPMWAVDAVADEIISKIKIKQKKTKLMKKYLILVCLACKSINHKGNAESAAPKFCILSQRQRYLNTFIKYKCGLFFVNVSTTLCELFGLS